MTVRAFCILFMGWLVCANAVVYGQEERQHDRVSISSWEGRQLRSLRHKGKAFFPIGAYGGIRANNGRDFVDTGIMADNGWNIVLGGLNSDPEKALKTLDDFEANNLAYIYNAYVRLFPAYGNPEEFEKEVDLIKAIKDHPALAGYYIFDEPENWFWGRDEEIKEIREKQSKRTALRRLPDVIQKRIGWMNPLIKGIDPNPEHYTFMCIAWWDQYRRLQPLCDVNMPNSYPTNHTEKEFEGDQVQYVYDAFLAHQASVASGDSMGFIFTPLACDITQGIESYRPPTRAEFRYAMFSPITRGAMGCVFWVGYRCRQAYAEEVVFPVTRELASLEALLLGTWRDHEIKLHTKDEQTPTLEKYGNTPRITACVRELNGEFLIILANNVNAETSFQISSELWSANTSIQERSSLKNIEQINGMITDQLKPYEIKLYSWRAD